MNVLVVNAGSSSLKVRLLDDADDVVAALDLGRWSGGRETDELERFVSGLGTVDAVGHRVVHGGSEFPGPVRLAGDVRGRIAALAELAPLHQPRGVAGIDAITAVLPDVAAVACFDTSFHRDLPAAAATYALPRDWNERWGLRRYGFHGLSHAYAAGRAAEFLRRGDARVVTCHLGAGASLAAVLAGRSVDTTMGFTPLEGLVMATRPGSVDPGLLLWLLRHGGMSVASLGDALEHESGLAGLTGGDGDLREVRQGVETGDERAVRAFDVYTHRLRREIAGMAAAMDGLDALVFTGGVGEHQPPVRTAAAAGLGFLGVRLDEDANRAVAGDQVTDTEITAGGAAVRTFVVTAREDREIARQVRELLGRGRSGRERPRDRRQ
ncbi:acetate kinase [Actinophytocola xinjiangensis]|uniref:Acetate kinase n=1 Tax=Actinophytocola xinjiangensis TaxID=485602 RepID=A0A7Z0WRJ0_9PSEU|nr:acetate/propionate family kinase [Actinophytocola xinjiangensis]OLF14026.1 acetate kinase [Actinophytocola xinjiangensis]